MIKESLIESVDLNCNFLRPERLEFNSKAIISYVSSLGNDVRDFWDAIKILQSEETNLVRSSTQTELIWCSLSHVNLDNALMNLMGLNEDEKLPDERVFTTDEIEIIEPKIHLALRLLEKTFPEIYPYFKSICPYIVIARQNGFYGGTVSNRIGFIWLSPITEWTEVELCEQLFHEFIHTALFLEEMVHHAMPYTAKRMEEEDGLVTSSIRQVKRGYDKSYHAAFVSYGLICYYLRLGFFEKANFYLNPLIICLNELIENQKFLSENGINLIDELCQNVMKKKSLIESLSSLNK